MVVSLFDKVKIPLLFFLLFVSALLFYGNARGSVMIFSVLLFGVISSLSKDKVVKIASLGFLVVISLLNVLIYGINTGIDFSGGVRVVFSSDRVFGEDLPQIVNGIKQRLSSLGLTEVRVIPVGEKEIYVELPKSREKDIDDIVTLITKQGVFEAVVDGEVVLRGEDILVDTITTSVFGEGLWRVSFTVSGSAAERFSTMVRGKAGYPLYMFLDRPSNVSLILDKEKLFSLYAYDPADILATMYDVLSGSNITLLFLDEVNGSIEGNVITSKEVWNKLKERGFEVKGNVSFVDEKELYPIFVSPNVIERWEAIGLLSSPTLTEGVTSGRIIFNYQISGREDSIEKARERAKFISSILRGGSFPVKLYAVSRTYVPPSLGELFFVYSIIALFVSLVFVSLFVSFRYRKLKLVIPILAITIAEMVVLISTVGSFTIDLAAMAGIIAAVGVSIDSQIVITDELLKKGSLEEKLKKAFFIVNNSAIVAILAVIPLLFSSLVEVIGFAVVAVLGSLLGVLISRPAYAAIAERVA